MAYLCLRFELFLPLLSFTQSLVAPLDLIAMLDGRPCRGVLRSRVVRDANIGTGNLHLRDLEEISL